MPSPGVDNDDSYLQAVSAVSANDVWAVGTYSDQSSGGYSTLSMHWDGSAWSVVNSPNEGSSMLFGASAVSASDVWAVGAYYDSSAGRDRTLVEHYSCTGSTPTPTNTAVPSATSTATAEATGTATVPAPSPTPTACTISFVDVPPTHPFWVYIERLAGRGILGG